MLRKTLTMLAAVGLFSSTVTAEWTVDFSRRNKELRKKEYSTQEHQQQSKPGVFEVLFSSGEPIQEVVILNTDKGFVPSSVAVQEGHHYRIHVVNVNSKDKNVSFVLDAFSEHHATYYGKIKSFHVTPQKEGVYTFQSPETSAQGKLVVHPAKHSRPIDIRVPASE